MSEINAVRAVERPTPAPAIEPSFVPQRRADPLPASNRLEPAVTLDVRASADSEPAATIGQKDKAASIDAQPKSEADFRGQFVRDTEDARQIVYQIVDPGSGSVVIQLPSVSALKARAYAEAAANHSAEIRQSEVARQSAKATASVDRSA